MKPRVWGCVSIGLLAAVSLFAAGDGAATAKIPLTVAAGAPLRVYLTKRISIKAGAPVRATVMEPVYSYDHVVLPAGATLEGHISSVRPVPKMRRFLAMVGGDFTPLHVSAVTFETLDLPSGEKRAIETQPAEGQRAIYFAVKPKKVKKEKQKKKEKNAQPQGQHPWREAASQQASTAIKNQISARTMGLSEVLRGPGKRERLEEFLLFKLPWHPQWYRTGTRFDAVLSKPLSFGSETVSAADLKWIGAPLKVESLARARLLTPLDSATAKKGDAVEAVLAMPVYSSDNHLLLPEGTRLSGEVIEARPARWLHRGGRLRFRFEKVEAPGFALAAAGQIQSIEAGYQQSLKVDSEGGVTSSESKKRFLAPAIAALIATKAWDRDAGKTGGSGGGDGNYGGRTLGGFSGFGYLGALAAQSSKIVGGVLGFYGLGWSVYSTVLAKGQEVDFAGNTAMDVRLGPREPLPAGSHFLAAGATALAGAK